MHSFLIFLPVLLFLLATLFIGFFAQRWSGRPGANFSREYFIGGRSLGGFVLAMTMVATYSSVSSFVGGPGMAWQRGFGWVYYASIQVVAAFLVMGVVGKKLAVLGRKTDSVTVVDVIRARYGSDLLALIAELVLVVFFTATTVAQFVGGATLFAAAAGVDYRVGLFIFALVVVAYTSVGGFRGVAITDTVCALAMLVGMAVIAAVILKAGGGMGGIMATLSKEPRLLEPTSGGTLSVPFLVSQWLLCGFCTMGLPQSLVRNLGYKDSRSLHRAMIYGTVVVGAMMVGMHLLGALSRGVIAEVPAGKTTDAIMPTLIIRHMHPVLAGVAIVGPLAATMSTVSSLLLASSSAVIKDLYQYYAEKRGAPSDATLVRPLSMTVTGIIGLACVLIALKPPSVIVWINLFAFGGLQTAFFWTFILGLFWHRANAAGATLSMAGGVVAYCAFMALKIPLGGFHQIVVGIVVGLVLFVAGSYWGKPTEERVLRVFFPERY
jgi:sodium/pantothenate symporter